MRRGGQAASVIRPDSCWEEAQIMPWQLLYEWVVQAAGEQGQRQGREREKGEKNSRSCAHKSIHTDSFVNGAMNAQMREREGIRKTEREKERQSGSACFHITYTPHCSTQYDSPRFDYSLKVINKWPIPPLLPPSPAWLPALAYVSASCQNEKHFPRCRFSLNVGKGGTQKKHKNRRKTEIRQFVDITQVSPSIYFIKKQQQSRWELRPCPWPELPVICHTPPPLPFSLPSSRSFHAAFRFS